MSEKLHTLDITEFCRKARNSADVWRDTVGATLRYSGGVNFGKVTSLLHEAINDDPTPRRREIKDYQENLYSFVHAIDDKIEVFRPNISQVLRIKK